MVEHDARPVAVKLVIRLAFNQPDLFRLIARQMVYDGCYRGSGLRGRTALRSRARDSGADPGNSDRPDSPTGSRINADECSQEDDRSHAIKDVTNQIEAEKELPSSLYTLEELSPLRGFPGQICMQGCKKAIIKSTFEQPWTETRA